MKHLIFIYIYFHKSHLVTALTFSANNINCLLSYQPQQLFHSYPVTAAAVSEQTQAKHKHYYSGKKSACVFLVQR